jgi:hypothetical protein
MRLPYKRTVRQLKDNSYKNDGNGDYVKHPDYAENPTQYIRAFLLIQKDVQNLFDFIEPADINLPTFSYRIHELLMRTCIEIEANFKAILTENGYVKKDKKGNLLDFKIVDYRKVNKSHKLSSYEIQVPNWWGTKGIRRPFQDWIQNDTLPWYVAYNNTKHDRHKNFQFASFKNLIDSVCGLVALLSAQFITNDFAPDCLLSLGEGPNDGMETAIGGYFRVRFPKDWLDLEKYDFDWHKLNETEKVISKYDYNKKQ